MIELGTRVAEHRKRCGLSLRAAAEQSEVPFNTLARAEKGKLPDLANFKRLVEWLGLDPVLFFAPQRTRQQTTVEAVRHILRYDPHLDDRAAECIAGLVEILYATLGSPQDEVVVHVNAAPTLVPAAATLLGGLLTAMKSTLTTDPEQSVALGWSG